MPVHPRFAQLFAALAFIVPLSLATPILQAQATSPAPAQQQPQPDSASPNDQGPNDQGPIVVPKKKAPAADQPPPDSTSQPTNPQANTPQSAATTPPTAEAQEVTVNVGVLLEKTHNFLPGLKPANFRLYEDGQEQKIIGFNHSQAPITALVLCESASTGNRQLRNEIDSSVSSFTSQLRPEDYAALMTFALHTQIVSDFTHDKSELAQAIHQLQPPNFSSDQAPASALNSSEHNLYDALYEGLDRLSHIAGQKYILLIASGQDISSKTTLTALLDKIRNTPDITIFTFSTLDRAIPETPGDNPMRTFAQITGGLSFTPGSLTETHNDINQDVKQKDVKQDIRQITEAIRSQYQLLYHPTNPKPDGAYRRIQVELVDDEGHPLTLEDEKHKLLKYDLVVREGYRAKPAVE